MEYNAIPPGEGLDFLDACVVIEETCAAIYRYFASLFGDIAESANFWTKLAEDEDQHAGKFRLAVKNHGSSPECLEDVSFLVNAILVNLDSLVAKMKQNPPLLREAFLTAAILELSIEKFHVKTAKSLVNAEVAELLSTMAHNDRCHREIMLKMM